MNTQALERLEQIRKKNQKNPIWINQDLYRFFYKEEMYISAYENIKSNKGALTRGSTSETFNGLSIKKIQRMIEMMRLNKYEFQPTRKLYIPKPGKKTFKPLEIPNYNDKVIQEIIRMILEAIYEPRFSNRSHGFRPGKSCHTALREIKQKFAGMKWLIKGDIKSAYDNVDHRILLNLLKQSINDERFILLIKRVLKAGYLKLGAPRSIISSIDTFQRSIISPILFNIYLSPLDEFIEMLKKKYEKIEKKRQTTKEYNSNAISIARQKKKIDNCNDLKTRKELVTTLNKLKTERVKIKAYKDDSILIRIQYVRYADDWVVGITGPKSTAESIRQEIAQFLKEKLNFDLNLEKTKITYLKKNMGFFLGYQLRMKTKIKYTKIKNKAGIYFKKKSTGHFINLDAPILKLIARLCLKGFCNGEGKPTSKRSWTTLDDKEIIRMYNKILNGLASYYSGADNQRKLIRIQYILQHSCACTLAQRHKSTVKKIYGKHGREMQIKHYVETKNGPVEKIISLNLRKFSKLTKRWLTKAKSFNDPFKTYAYRRTKSKVQDFCCICGCETNVEMHHVKHLKGSIHTKRFNQILEIINRKQIPVCKDCHTSIHSGKYDKMKLSDLVFPN
uniref:Putative reverse transcriptase and intron maturase n=1 Tax=Rhexinema sarcinoideum TaxID=43261 RepID=A0A1B2RYT4_9CHLO|nr:putative reverse transcriptase and intron maturase [Rhexinema sarcinoideum]